ncbi:unnamed protein product [Merluccius merluccius]
MCWLPADQPLVALLQGDQVSAQGPAAAAACSSATQLLASRLRSIGDQLDKRRTAGGGGHGQERHEGPSGGQQGPPSGGQSSGRLKGFILRTAVRLAALALLLAVRRRHL